MVSSQQEEWLDMFLNFSKLSIIVGDFNIDRLNVEKSAKLKSLMDSVNMKQKVNDFTRIDRQSTTLIDKVYSSTDSIKVTTDPLLKISDHETLVLNINVEPCETIERKFKCWNRYS